MAALGDSWPGAVAVSGGGDSLALMYLLAEWARARKLPAPHILTVDHGLVPGSRMQANEVKAQAASLGLGCHVLIWKGAKPSSGIEAAARAARYKLMGEWCRKHKTGFLFVAHSEDDQSETFLLRLARGSGLDGLSAMRAAAPFPVADFGGLSLMRPLLGFTRAQLRGFLSGRGIVWREDPMNADPQYARVRLRAIRPVLDEAGLTAPRIAAAARHLARARDAFERQTADLLAAATRHDGDRLLIDREAIVAAPRELALRTLATLLQRTGGQPYRPRFEQLESLFDSLMSGRLNARTLHGCRLGRAPRRLAVFGAGTLMLEKERARRKPSRL